MASTQALSAAAQDRKARLAQLKSLKRKQPDESQDDSQSLEPAAKSPRHEEQTEQAGAATTFLSGRNYDAETKGPKLGFETAPSEGQETLEKKAATLAAETKRQAEEEEKADKPLDLFKIQPKKPNWDLKRDLERKLEILNVRTDNAIARIVRERITNQQKAAKQKSAEAANGQANGSGQEEGDAEAAGIDGTTLVEATNVREREDEEDARRDREEEEEEALLDPS
jgi:coiled-coil domain-containing protein 12